MQDTLRAEDLIARYAGDEFVVMLLCNEDIALQRAEQIRSAIEKLTVISEGHKIQATVSIGVLCCLDINELDVTKVMSKVDEAMYKAKEAGRNRVVNIK